MAAKRNPEEPLHRVSGNLEPIGSNLKKNDGSVLDLTGATVAFRLIRISDATVVINNLAATVLNAAAGQVQYTPSGVQMDISAGLSHEALAMYWIVTPAVGNAIRLPYDGARWTLILHKETDG